MTSGVKIENLREYQPQSARLRRAPAVSDTVVLSAVEGGAAAASGARSPLALNYYVQHALKVEEPPPAHATPHHAHAHAHAGHAAHAAHALYDDEYRRAADDRLERPTVVSMGS